MSTRQRKRSFLGKLPLPLALVATLGYFGYHLVNGDLGMRAKRDIEAERVALATELHRLEGERKKLLTRVETLRPEGIDRDLADERARLQLNLANADEIVLMRPIAAGAGGDQTAAADLRAMQNQ